MEERKIVIKAREYLLSFEEVNEEILERHLEHWRTRKLNSIGELLFAVLDSAKNRGAMPNYIGDIRHLKPFLFNFEAKDIVEIYGKDWEKLFDTIKAKYTPPASMNKENPKNSWVIFSKTIISAAVFLSQFASIKDFDKFVSQFYLNEYTRLALPLLLTKEIFGLGFALACDFLKENGYPKFVKPDRQIKAIFRGLHLTESTSDYEVFKDVIRFSDAVDEIPYRVDKLFWLIGSGKFYLDNIKIKSNRNEFIQQIINQE